MNLALKSAVGEKMRRGRARNFSILSITFLILAAFFNLVSYAFDQIIVQDEDKIRKLQRSLQIDRNNLNNLGSSINFLQDLSYEIDYESNKLLSLLGFNAKAYATFKNEDIFEDSLVLNISKIDNERLSNVYKEKLKENIDQTNLRIDNLYKVFEYNFSSGLGYDLIKETDVFKSIELRKISKIPESYKEDYFKKETDRYKLYSEIYKYISELTSFAEDLGDLGLSLQENFSNNYVDYYNSLDEFSSDQNNTNYFILFSIFSQILGLTFLLLLFRYLINENI